MKNFKQVLALVVVFCVMLSTVAFAVPADVVGTDYEQAAARLGALGIMVGDDTGAFNADKVVTRAEMAKIVVIMVGSATAADSAKGAVTFTDVAADHWANGFVNVAASLGIVNGIGDKKFAPEAEVTYAQAVTMIMRAMGYETAAQDKGGFPTGYLVCANEREVTDGVSGSLNAGCIRGSIAQLVDNALDKPLMVQVTYSTSGDKDFVVSGPDGGDKAKLQTILGTKLKLFEYKATFDKFDADKKTVDFSDTPVVSDSSVSTTKALSQTGVKYIDGVSFNETLKDLPVVVWLSKDSSGNPDKIVAYKIQDNVEVFYSSIKTYNDVSADKVADTDNYTFTGATGTEITDITFNNDKSYSVTLPTTGDLANNYSVTNSLYTSTGVDAQNINSFKGKIAKVIVKDGSLNKIYFYTFKTSVGIVKEVTDSYIKLVTDLTNDSNTNSIPRLNVAERVTVLLDGQPATVKDIKAGQYIEYATYKLKSDSDENSYFIAVSSATAVGKLSKVSASKLYIAGNEEKAVSGYYTSIDGGATYTKEADADLTKSTQLSNLLQEEVTVVKNLVGKVFSVVGTSKEATDFYAFVDTYTSSNTDGDAAVKLVVNNKGVLETKNYTIASSGTDIATGVTTANSLYTLKGLRAAKNSATNQAFYKITLDSDGKVKKIVKPSIKLVQGDSDAGRTPEVAFDVAYNFSGVYNTISVNYLDDTTVKSKYYTVSSDSVFYDTTNITVTSSTTTPKLVAWDLLKTKDVATSGANFKMYTVYDDTTKKFVGGILENGMNGLSSDNAKFAFVDDIYSSSSSEKTLKLIGANGETIEKVVDYDAYTTLFNEIEIDNSIIVYEENGADEIDLKDVVVLDSASWSANTLTNAQVQTAGNCYSIGNSKYVYYRKTTATTDYTKADTVLGGVSGTDELPVATQQAFVLVYSTSAGEYQVSGTDSIKANSTIYYLYNEAVGRVVGVVATDAN